MKVLMLLKSPIDNDSRVKKEVASLKSKDYRITIVSVNGLKLNGIDSKVVHFEARRRFLPGISNMLSFIVFLKAAFGKMDGHKFIHAHDLNTLLAAVLLKLFNRKGVRLIYDSHEFAINDTPNESKWGIRIKYLLEKLLIPFADKVIVVSDSIAREYSVLYNIDKPAVVLNCPNYQEVDRQNLFRDEFNIDPNQKIYLYQGGLGFGRGIEILLESFASMSDANVAIVFMGYGPLEGKIKDYVRRYSNIFLKEAVSSKVLLSYTASADVGISFIEDSCLSYRYCLPNKLFEYIMAGLPVIVSNLPEMSRLVSEYDIGVVAKDNTIDGLKQAVQDIENLELDGLSDSVARLRKKYSWEEQERQLYSCYHGEAIDVY